MDFVDTVLRFTLRPAARTRRPFLSLDASTFAADHAFFRGAGPISRPTKSAAAADDFIHAPNGRGLRDRHSGSRGLAAALAPSGARSAGGLVEWETMRLEHPGRAQFTAPRGFTLVEIMVVVVLIGLLAAMALPAFTRVTATSQDKAILNMARQLAAAADQYYLENGCSTVHTADLIGATSYIKALNRVTGHEQIPGYMTQGITLTIGNVAGQRTITYAP